MTTIHAGGSASGRCLPPFVVYKGKHLYTSWTKGGPDGTMFSVSESGWMEKANFLSWFTKLFVPAVKALLQTGPVVLFFDGHHSHLSLKLLEEGSQGFEHPSGLFTSAHLTHPAADGCCCVRANESKMANDTEEVQDKHPGSHSHKGCTTSPSEPTLVTISLS